MEPELAPELLEPLGAVVPPAGGVATARVGGAWTATVVPLTGSVAAAVGSVETPTVLEATGAGWVIMGALDIAPARPLTVLELAVGRGAGWLPGRVPIE